jgi:uncharacterized protein (DUF2384 family)
MGKLVPARRPGPPLINDDPLWAHAVEVLGDVDRAREWMESPHPLLGMPPLKFAKSKGGRDEVDRILSSIEHGLPA